MSIKKWSMAEIDPAQSKKMAEQTGLEPFVCDILQARGVNTPQKAETFFGDAFCDPFLLPDMDKAVNRIRKAVEVQEEICVYGDYDCDGMTATVLLTSYLQAQGARVSYYIPQREGEGYGLHCAAVKKLAARGVGLIVTVDNGITAFAEIAYAASLGVEVVVTDHHLPREELPAAVALVDPHRPGCKAPFCLWAGVGVVFKLICAMEDGDGAEMMEYYGDLVCIGTVADIVPLTGENRTIVKMGLQHLQYTDNAGLRALMKSAGLLEKNITSENVGFLLAPRINAAGRLGFTQQAVDLLFCEEEDEAHRLAESISAKNKERQSMELPILNDISFEIAKDPTLLHQRLLILSGKGWNQGIIGIVCSKLVERYAKPCLLISIEGDEAHGSGRSIEGFSLVDAVAACAAHLTNYGGHAMAAGFSLSTAKLGAFRSAMLEQARKNYEVMPVPTIQIDRLCRPAELTLQNLHKLEVLAPFGTGNEPPVFALQNVSVEALYPIGSDGAHLRLRLRAGAESFYAVYFGMTAQRFGYAPGDVLDVAAVCSCNVYNAEERVSIKIKAVRPAQMQQDGFFESLQQYDCYRRGEALASSTKESLLPQREEVAVIYRYLRANHGFTGDLELFCCRFFAEKIASGKIKIILDILQELGLILMVHVKTGVVATLLPTSGKVDLERSSVLQALRR